MRINTLFIILALSCVRLSAQGYDYFGIGYNMAFLQSEGLDFVTNRYNETRPYLYDQMDEPRYFDGLSIRGGLARNAFLVDFGYTQQSCVVSAEGIDATGVAIQRDLKNKWNTLDVAFGVNVGDGEKGAFALGVNFGLNSEKSLTRSDTPDNIGKANFAQVQKQFKVGISPFVQLILAGEGGAGVLIRPYYAWSPVTTDYSELNAYINPYTAVGDPNPLDGDLKGLGVTVLIVGFDPY